MNRYFFNFREGDEIARDRIGMFLPDLDAAREEAIRTWRDLVEVAANDGELPDCAIQIADAAGETVLTVPFGDRARVH
ncbi:MAG TPA: hypothetical protein VGG69_08165 [Rhizomicrobium sp.]